LRHLGGLAIAFLVIGFVTESVAQEPAIVVGNEAIPAISLKAFVQLGVKYSNYLTYYE